MRGLEMITNEQVTKWTPIFKRMAGRIVRDNDVDDVVQEVWEQLCRMDMVPEDGWAIVAFRRIHNWRRDNYPAFTMLDIDALDENKEPRLWDLADPEQEYTASELAYAAYVALEELPEPLKAAFKLRELGDVDYEHVAQNLRTTEGNARRLVSEARKILKYKLTGE